VALPPVGASSRDTSGAVERPKDGGRPDG